MSIRYSGLLKVFQQVSVEVVSPDTYKEIYKEIMLAKKVSICIVWQVLFPSHSGALIHYKERIWGL